MAQEGALPLVGAARVGASSASGIPQHLPSSLTCPRHLLPKVPWSLALALCISFWWLSFHTEIWFVFCFPIYTQFMWKDSEGGGGKTHVFLVPIFLPCIFWHCFLQRRSREPEYLGIVYSKWEGVILWSKMLPYFSKWNEPIQPGSTLLYCMAMLAVMTKYDYIRLYNSQLHNSPPPNKCILYHQVF